MHEIAELKEGSRVGVVCASDRGTENIAETLAIAGTKGVELISATIHDDERLTLIDRTADLILMSREALAQKLDQKLHRPERVRAWTYEFDPAALELLRRAHRARRRRPAASPPRDGCPPGTRRPGLTSFARCGRSPWLGRHDAATDSNRSSGATGRWTRPTPARRAGSPRA